MKLAYATVDVVNKLSFYWSCVCGGRYRRERVYEYIGEEVKGRSCVRVRN
jgi:hypothetical protein